MYNFNTNKINKCKVYLTLCWRLIIIYLESKLSIEWSDILKNKLEEFRKERGIKQEELAEHLEVSRQTIGSLENDRYNPSIILAIKIARFFNKTVEEIFIYEED